MKLLTSDLQSTAVEAIHELLLQNSYLDSATPIFRDRTIHIVIQQRLPEEGVISEVGEHY